MSRVAPCRRTDGRTDRYDEANSRFSKFCEIAQKGIYSLFMVCRNMKAKRWTN